RQRRAHILANFDFAGEHRYPAVLVDMQPGIETLGYLMLMVSRAARFLSDHPPRRDADEQSSTQQFKEVSPIQIKRMPQSRDLMLPHLGVEFLQIDGALKHFSGSGEVRPHDAPPR